MGQTISAALQHTLRGVPANAQIYIAYSGGLDSQVLLHALVRCRKANAEQLTAVHVNYGLSTNADLWQTFCEKQCATLGISLRVKKASLDSKINNLEQRARQIRYDWFAALMKPGAFLLTAHHQNDQAETIILRLLRASGVRGLAAIPHSRSMGNASLIRPLLNFPKNTLQRYAQQHGLQWVEDESNVNLLFDRNFVRHKVLPQLLERWPQAIKQLTRSADNCRDEQALLNEFAALDIHSLQFDDELSLLDVAPPLSLRRFVMLSHARQRNVMQYLLLDRLKVSCSVAQLREWLSQVQAHTASKNSQLRLTNVTLALHDGRMYFVRQIADMASREIPWDMHQPLLIPELSCALSAEVEGSHGTVEALKPSLDAADVVCVHWRRGGERMTLTGETFSRSLKKRLQEKRIAPWLRQSLPLVSLNNRIVWSAALGMFAPKWVDSKGASINIKLVHKPVPSR